MSISAVMSDSTTSTEEIYRKGFIRLERHNTYTDFSFLLPNNLSSQGQQDNYETDTRIVIENPDESLVREVILARTVGSNYGAGYAQYEIRLVPHRSEDLRSIYNKLEQVGVDFDLGQTNGGGIYSETPADELDQDLKTNGYVTLYSKWTDDPAQLAPQHDPTQHLHIKALHRSRLMGRDEVNNAIEETITQALQSAKNGLFTQANPASQRRMMTAIGGSINRIYDRMHTSGHDR